MAHFYKSQKLVQVGSQIGLGVLRALLCTVRLRYIDERTRRFFLDAPPNYIYALWHGTILVPMWANRNNGAGVLVSHSRDGEYIARIAEGFGYEAVRGSSSRGGHTALRRMVEKAREGKHLMITPDGPRGPLHHFQIGAVYLARMTGLPLVPIGIALTRHWTVRAGGWDRFLVPKPCALGVLKAAEAVSVPRRASEEHMEGLRKLLERALRKETDQAQRVADALARS